jgi:hypothetical protein
VPENPSNEWITMDYGRLPVTGGIALGSIMLGQGSVAAIAVGMILAGALLVRLSFRRNKKALDA